MAYSTLPSVTISTVFGEVKKLIWFEVIYSANTYGTFDVNLFIELERTRDITITIFNNGSNQVVYQKIFRRSSNITTITDSARITHIPSTMSNVYGLKIE